MANDEGERTVLVVEDDVPTRELVKVALREAGTVALEAATPAEALRLVEAEAPDLVLLDVHLPGGSGLDICRRIRERGIETPVILLTADNNPVQIVAGLEFGADDYVTKPFAVREVIARVRAQLRRTENAAPRAVSHIEYPGLSIDLGRREVFVDGQPVQLTLTEFNLLALLAARSGSVVSRAELLQRVWGYEHGDIVTRTVDAHVYRLRKKIERDSDSPQFILSVPGVGYRFAA